MPTADRHSKEKKMKKNIATGIIALLMMAGMALFAGAASAAPKGKVTLCHKGHNITVSGNAVLAHLAHGDTRGPCESGKGKGSGVAMVSYHCLGVANQLNSQTSPYSYLADSIVVDAGGGQATLEGAATGDLVSNDVGVVPTHMAGASISVEGLSLQSFDTCGASAQSVLSSVIVGTDEFNPDTAGAAYAEIKFNYHVQLETQNSQGADGIFSAFAETTLEVVGIHSDSFTVSANGALVDAPPGLTVTDLSNGNHHVYEVSGTYTVPVQLFYGNGISNIVLTSFKAAGEVSQVDVSGSTIVAGFTAAEALETLTYEVVSLDPNVSFTFLPAD